MYYEILGEGAPLVLLHGYTQSGRMWDPFVGSLAEHYRLLVPDQPAHGRSTNSTNDFADHQSAMYIFAMLAELDIDGFRAMGLSYGAITLLHAAMQRPARVEAMVLIGASNRMTEEHRAACRELTPDHTEWDWQMLRQLHHNGDDQIQALLHQFHRWKDLGDEELVDTSRLSTITAKTLIVHGDRDEYFPVSVAVGMYREIPESYLWVVPNGGHAPIEGENETKFRQIALEFLTGEWGEETTDESWRPSAASR